MISQCQDCFKVWKGGKLTVVGEGDMRKFGKIKEYLYEL
jgi:hypothetical protein